LNVTVEYLWCQSDIWILL